MKIFMLTFSFMSLCYVSIGQAQNSVPEQITAKPLVIQKPYNSVRVKTTQGYTAPDNSASKSDYNNWESEILNKLTINYIPEDFPKYSSPMSNDEYKSLITLWAEKNQTLIKQ